MNDSWDEFRDKFCLEFFRISCIIDLHRDICHFWQNKKESIGKAWCRFSCLVKSGPVLSIRESLLLRNFYEDLDKHSSYYLVVANGGSFLHKSPIEGRKILDNIMMYTDFTVKCESLRKESKSSQEDLSTAESNPPPFTFSDSAIKTRSDQEHRGKKKFNP